MLFCIHHRLNSTLKLQSLSPDGLEASILFVCFQKRFSIYLSGTPAERDKTHPSGWAQSPPLHNVWLICYCHWRTEGRPAAGEQVGDGSRERGQWGMQCGVRALSGEMKVLSASLVSLRTPWPQAVLQGCRGGMKEYILDGKCSLTNTTAQSQHHNQ